MLRSQRALSNCGCSVYPETPWKGMNGVYWLEQTEADVPVEDSWLSAGEAVLLNGLRFAKRRADWRVGRWTAKRALMMYLEVLGRPQTIADIEIRAGSSGAPEVFFSDKPAGVRISLSHRAGAAICALAPSHVAVGCDLELIERRSEAFLADYLTTQEQALVIQTSWADRPRLSTLIWSAKESALKALGVGLRLDTRCVEVSFQVPWKESGGGDRRFDNAAFGSPPAYGPNRWCPLQVCYIKNQVFSGWWQYMGNFLRTLVAAPPPPLPTLLQSSDVLAHSKYVESKF